MTLMENASISGASSLGLKLMLGEICREDLIGQLNN